MHYDILKKNTHFIQKKLEYQKAFNFLPSTTAKVLFPGQ